MVRAIRGATTVENNDREEIIEATKEMLETIISENNIKTEDNGVCHFYDNARS